MYTDREFKVIPPSEQSKGTVILEGRSEHDSTLDEAYTRLLIVARSDALIDDASRLTTKLNDFIRLRAEYGAGNIPNEIIREFRLAERNFAQLSRNEFDA